MFLSLNPGLLRGWNFLSTGLQHYCQQHTSLIYRVCVWTPVSLKWCDKRLLKCKSFNANKEILIGISVRSIVKRFNVSRKNNPKHFNLKANDKKNEINNKTSGVTLVPIQKLKLGAHSLSAKINLHVEHYLALKHTY